VSETALNGGLDDGLNARLDPRLNVPDLVKVLL